MSDIQIVAGRVWHEEEYPPERRARWHKHVREALLNRGLSAPIIYPGSVPRKCEKCDVTIAVGPRQQQALKTWGEATFMCLLCLETLAEIDEAQIQVHGLGNPDDPNAGRTPDDW